MMGLATSSILSIGSLGLSTLGSLQEGKAQKEAADWNSAMSRYDATLAKTKARLDEISLRREGAINELLRRRSESMDLGAFRAQAGASGFATDSPTNQAVVQDIMKKYDLESELERRNIEWDASIIRYQGDIGAASSIAESKLYKYTGKQARRASYIEAGTTLLSGAADIKRKGLLRIK